MALEDFKCTACGGSVSFDTDKQKLVCDFCGTEYDIDAPELHEHDHEGEPHVHHHSREEVGGEKKVTEVITDNDGNIWEQEKEFWSDEEEDEFKVYSCNSCGGEIIGDETMAATSCPFCNNNVVIPNQFEGDLRPDFVIPFKLDKEYAKDALKKFYSGRKLLPKVFMDQNHINEIKGIYVPFWLYSGTANADLEFTGTKVRMYSDSNYNYTETKYYDINRGGAMDFKFVPVDGSSKIDDILMESIEPYKWEEATVFTSQYLAGFLANRYDMEAKDCIENAEKRIKNSTIETFKNSVSGYDSVSLKRTEYQLGKVNINYALAPVWFLNTEWNGKFYTFAMNGQTGKIIGDDMPIDKGIMMRKWLTVGAIVAVIIFIIAIMVFRFL
jgi:predicted RNA-binding Zn-ribbon protein involved in translation (DUF1610 family)